MKVAAGLVAALLCSAALAALPVQRTLSFDQRVNAQAAIERVYYAHQLGTTRPFDEAVPRAVLENKVRKYLEQTVALRTYWKTAVTDETLQRELERMAQGTRMPERLQELYTALGNDPFLIKECLARPALVDRLTHNFYSFDPTMHATARAQAEAIHQLLATGELSPKADHPNRTVREIVVGGNEAGVPTPELPLQQRVTQGELQKQRGELPAVVGEASEVKERSEEFSINVILNETSTGFRVANYVVAKTAWDSWWSTVRGSLGSSSVAAAASAATTSLRLPAIHRGSIGQVTACTDDGWDNGSLGAPPDSRIFHTAVWTGNQMLVWGGQHGNSFLINTGGRYDPATDTWTSISTIGAPLARANHTAVWTGTMMIVWGGSGRGIEYFNTGGRYDPATDTWMPTTISGAPTPRDGHTAVWTGNLMVVWGGSDNFSHQYFNTGGRYDPSTDSWMATSTVAAPSVRRGHTAVWTGSRMVVWGGSDGTSYPVNLPPTGGGRYNPASDSWTPTAYANEPTPRSGHSAVWTGSLMVVWGGYSLVPCEECPGHFGYRYVDTGARYNPVTDHWTATSPDGAPSPRSDHKAVWTGHLMLIWGPGGVGGRYDPATNTWTPLSSTGAPSGRQYSTALWTGSLMIVWGGHGGPPTSADYLNSGGRYDPWTDSWTPTSTGGGPSARNGHTAVWTGSLMVVWGGADFQGYLNTGGRYDPALDHWAPTATTDVPAANSYRTAVWTGSLMAVWGISPIPPYGNDGGRYDPVTDRWTPITASGAPSTRNYHTAVWTGSRMVVWGGVGPAGFLATGGRYDPATDSWTPTSMSGAPSGRIYHSALWTGGLMVVWGGYFEDSTHYGILNTGGRYDPESDNWTPTSTDVAPSARVDHTANWAGNLMVVWGGSNDYHNGLPTNTGARYDPLTNVWMPTSLTSAPSALYGPTAVSTGNLLMVWGTPAFSPGIASGGWYDPATDHWTKLSNVGEPSGRARHSAVWTGSTMIVWGGSNAADLNDGGRYSLGASLDADCDGDGFGASAGDCNDHDVSVYPGAPELCDGRNTDCLDSAWPVAAFSESDRDGDGFRTCEGDCDDFKGLVHPGAPELCDGIKNNCSDPSWSFASETDADRDGYRVCQGDCDDTNRFINPGRPEFCDGVDNDCDGVLDDGGDALCESGDPCYDGVCSGADGCEITLTTNTCDDGNACTSGDVCVFGNCRGTLAAGAACDDYNECTGGDTCTSFGGCQGTPLSGNACHEQDPCVTAGTCQNGFCGGWSVVNCDDGDICTGLEFCNPVSGCFSVVPPDCDDGNICTTDSCDPATGCINTNNAEPCDDGDACTAGDTCGGGLCLPGTASYCDDYNPCTADSCNPQSGCVHVPEPEFTYCDDYDACTGADYCDGYGTCVSPYPPLCDDHIVCTEDYCDPVTGCSYRFFPAGTSCSDDNACNGVELCDGAGECAPGTSPTCDDNNPCTDDFCSSATGCVNANNTNTCNDGNACTQSDRCANGACAGSNPVVCTASDQCHAAGICVPASGACSNPIQPNGTVCNDASLCTTGETCQAGTCTPAFSGLNEPNPRSNGYYMRLCLGPHSGDQLTNADAVCVGQVADSFAGIATVANLCAVLQPSHPSSDPCDRTAADLMVLALNICRARVCTSQSIDSQCGDNENVGQSLAESDGILQSPSRDDDTCAHAKCLDEEINTGRALELNTLGLRREGSGVRLDWRPPFLDDGTGHASKYHVWSRVQGSLAPFAKIGITTTPTYLDTLSGSGAFEYEVTAVMN